MNTHPSKDDFIEVYESLDQAGKVKTNLYIFWVLVKTRANIRLIAGVFFGLIWPYLWRSLAWLTFATLTGVTVVQLAR